jgi:hypothetical protein
MSWEKKRNYYNWSVTKGDYERDAEFTTTHQKKRDLKKKIKLIITIVFYFIIVSMASYFLVKSL